MIEGNRHQLEVAGALFPVKRLRYQVESAKYFEDEAEQSVNAAASALV
jgi:hypothetical protein